ncbi:MAG TPA: hypothetical protein PKW66_24225, partial [Polyangiaceae bacterium]|nr:hypothetical protein [Polyangiaceae bacterium]
LCANVSGQLVTYLMVAFSKPGDASHELYVCERDSILRDLKEKATLLGQGIQQVPGMFVDIPQGAMYAFVRFELPHKPGVDPTQMSADQREKYEAERDNAYCLALLEETGICVVPGSGFGQRAGTLHFRTTFLPPRDEMEDLVKHLGGFHVRYVEKLRSSAS